MLYYNTKVRIDEIIKKSIFLFFQFDLYAGRLIHEYIRYLLNNYKNYRIISYMMSETFRLCSPQLWCQCSSSPKFLARMKFQLS
jgi:hypothetical protein